MKLTIEELWADFWKWSDQHPAGPYFFRGQADSSPIRPKIGRTEYNYTPTGETALFTAFARSARPFVSGDLNNFELLALAQHHGCPTRLVDWSTSPLVAAWFAVSSYPSDTDACIFALNRDEVETLDTETRLTSTGAKFEGPLSPKRGVYLIETAQVSARIKTQRGIFTLHGVPTEDFSIPSDQTFTIPKDLRAELQNRLMDIGIDASHIFPDLDGMCKALDWRVKTGKLNIVA